MWFVWRISDADPTMLYMDERLVRYFEGGMSPDERLDFLQAVDSDRQLKKEFIRIQNVRLLMNLVPGKTDPKYGKEAYGRFRKMNRQKTVRRTLLRVTAYAASIALLIAIAWSVLVNYGHIFSGSNEIYVPLGQRARLTLDDGTVVWLNAESRLEYPSHFFGRKRKVALLSGEAFFEVTTGHPFVVSVQDLDITVLGTRFNINNYPETGNIQTSLIDGRVRASDVNGQGVILNPNEQLNYMNGVMEVTMIDNPDYFLWKEGIYSFLNEPFIRIIQKLERYYNVEIVVEDLPFLDFEYTGKFRQQDGVDVILKMIQKIHPFKIEKEDDRIILSR